MLTAMLRAVGQLDDPAILGVLARSLVAAALCFAALCAGSAWGLHHALAHAAGWVAWLAGALGGAAVLVSALWLFLPVAVAIASFFTDRIAAAVERRWYPDLPAPRPAAPLDMLGEGLMLGAQVLALNCLSLLLALLVPGAGLVAGFAVSAWALGRSFFSTVALRRMGRAEEALAYRRRRVSVLAQGAMLALVGMVPGANLLVPVLGCAAMVHVLMQPGLPGRAGGVSSRLRN